MFATSPWSLARRTVEGRRALLLLVIAALLYGFGMHAARACMHAGIATPHEAGAAADSPCHADLDVGEAACEAHCRTDAQSGRASLSFDLPVAAPIDLSAALAPPVPVGSWAYNGVPVRRDNGPPLHILLHRLLR